jgi:hypothetical protein
MLTSTPNRDTNVFDEASTQSSRARSGHGINADARIEIASKGLEPRGKIRGVPDRAPDTSIRRSNFAHIGRASRDTPKRDNFTSFEV